MRWEYLGLMLLLLMIAARLGMARDLSVSGRDDDHRSLADCFDSCSLTDYIRITREETGRIGDWFWVFICSAVMLAVVIIAVLTGDSPPPSPLLPPDRDYLWPVL